MPVPSVVRRVALLAVACGAACAMPTRGAPRGYERHLDLPADVAAAVAAGAVRGALPFADPVPQAAGAPANAARDGYTVAYDQGADGTWVPRATHRLLLTAGGERIAVRADRLLGELRLPGFGAAATARVEVVLVGHPGGCSVRAALPVAVAADLARALDRAFALAADPDAACVGLADPNLAALTAARAHGAARLHLALGDPAGAEARLQRAARLGTPTARLQQQLGELAAVSGNLPLAHARLADALLRARDPVLRAHLATRLGALGDGGADPVARKRLAPGAITPAELAQAAGQLHTARRQQPDPVVDYGVASQLHRQDRDEMGAFACALLAREHAPGTGSMLLTRDGPGGRRGLDEFLRRVTHGVEPVAAWVERDPSLPVAAPAR